MIYIQIGCASEYKEERKLGETPNLENLNVFELQQSTMAEIKNVHTNLRRKPRNVTGHHKSEASQSGIASSGGGGETDSSALSEIRR